MPRSVKPPTVRVIELRFPSMGVVRRQLHERQASAVSYPTPWAMNVRLEDELTSRLRGGSFTGITPGARPAEILYRDRRLTCAGRTITASRVGSYTDKTYSPDVSDMLRPALFQFSQAGEKGEDVLALIPHKDQYLLGFTANQTWVQQGDPLSGARRRVSDQVGIVGADAWCVDHDTAYFLSSLGLYSIGLDGSGLKALSEDIIPEELTGVSDSRCTLTYSVDDGGVYIHKSGTDWFYDTERGAFWPFSTATTQSHVLIGPLRIGSPTDYGMVQRITGIMAADSGNVAWRLVVGDTAEQVCDDGKAAIEASIAGTDYSTYYRASGTWDEGRSKNSWPRCRAMWACLWLSATTTWAMEGVIVETIPNGRWR